MVLQYWQKQKLKICKTYNTNACPYVHKYIKHIESWYCRLYGGEKLLILYINTTYQRERNNVIGKNMW